MANTTNLNLDKIDENEQEFGDTVAIMRSILNSNYDIIDAAVYSVSANVQAYKAVSALYTPTATDVFLNVTTVAASIVLPTTAITGKTYYVGNDSAGTINIVGSSNINGTNTTVTAAGTYSLSTVVKTSYGWSKY